MHVYNWGILDLQFLGMSHTDYPSFCPVLYDRKYQLLDDVSRSEAGPTLILGPSLSQRHVIKDV